MSFKQILLFQVRVQNNGDADDPYVAIDYDEWVAAGREEEQEAKSGKGLCTNDVC